MVNGINLIVYPVRDIEKAKAVYGALVGAAPYVESPYYVGFKVGDQEVGLEPNGFDRGMPMPIGYYFVADLDAGVQALLDSGAQMHTPAHEVGGGRRIAAVTDPDGNIIGLAQDTH